MLVCEFERRKSEEKTQMNEKMANRKLSKFVHLINKIMCERSELN